MKHTTATAFANRAMVRLKRENWEGADEDCTACIELDSLYMKAWQRRATARRRLGKLLEAAQDFEEALRYDLLCNKGITFYWPQGTEHLWHMYQMCSCIPPEDTGYFGIAM